MRKTLSLVLILLGALLTLFLNGNIFKSSGLPPLGKLFNPYHGIWSSLEEDREIVLKGKDGDIEILIDKRGVPHIYAQSMPDAFIGQGYIEARDRTFQMQFIRQAAMGRLSEYFGDRTIGFDKWTRKKGIPSFVKEFSRDFMASPEVMANYQPYIDGANMYLSQLKKGQYPYESKLLDVDVEKWNIESVSAVFKYMGNMLAGGNNAIENTNVRSLLGDEMYYKYYKEIEENELPVIPLEKKYDFSNEHLKYVPDDELFLKPIYKAYYEKRNKNIGSNNWAVGADKSSTNYPIISCDPHLSLSLPSIWYELNIITPETNVYGVSFPGLPGIMFGFNENIAWGETNVGHDVQDLYHIKYTDKSRSHYWLDGKKVPVESRIDTFYVKGSATQYDTTYLTHWGPIIRRSNDGETDIAMSWLVTKSTPIREANTFVDGMQCKDYDCFKEKTGHFNTPAQNFLYADNSGTIGLRVNGLLPARKDQDGRFVAEGDKTSAGWNDWIPRDQNPQIENPEQGYLTSSNQRSAGPDYPYYYVGGFERYRNRAINDHLDSISNVTIPDMIDFQMNSYSKKAEDMLPLMLAAVDRSSVSERGQRVIDTLSNWNYYYEGKYTAPTLFERWFSRVRNYTWDEIAAYRDTMSVTYPLSTVLRDLIEQDPDDPIFDKLHTIPQENAQDIIRMAFDSLLVNIKDRDDEYLLYGNRIGLRIPHVAQFPGLGSGKLFGSGSGDVVNATNSTFGPSWRMVVGLGETPEAYGIYPGGQSGDPRSSMYKNRIEKWRTGKLDRLIYNVEKDKILSYE